MSSWRHMKGLFDFVWCAFLTICDIPFLQCVTCLFNDLYGEFLTSCDIPSWRYVKLLTLYDFSWHSWRYETCFDIHIYLHVYIYISYMRNSWLYATCLDIPDDMWRDFVAICGMPFYKYAMCFQDYVWRDFLTICDMTSSPWRGRTAAAMCHVPCWLMHNMPRVMQTRKRCHATHEGLMCCGVATISRLLTMIGLFCRISSLW